MHLQACAWPAYAGHVGGTVCRACTKSAPLGSVDAIVVVSLFFATSSDGGSLVVEPVAANGKESHVAQRVFWALTGGAAAVALISEAMLQHYFCPAVRLSD